MGPFTTAWPRAKLLQLHNAPTDPMTLPAPQAAGSIERVDLQVTE
jgi:hypothetical protein